MNWWWASCCACLVQAFHPDIDLCGQQAYLSFHMVDLTASPQACCAPLLSKLPLLTVRSHKVFIFLIVSVYCCLLFVSIRLALCA